ncbi:MAG: glycosyltransferase family 2 protein [bacterium]|nr:glycosyltransferase family 2 protein [bacterium]
MRRFFKAEIMEFLRNSIIPHRKVLLMGGVDADLLEAVRPSRGFQVCSEDADIDALKREHPDFVFAPGIGGQIAGQRFEYIILDDYLHYENRLDALFKVLKELMSRETKVFIMCVNPLAIFTLIVASKLGLPVPRLNRNILRLGDIENLARIFNYEVLDKGFRFICPFRLCGLGEWMNRVIPRIAIIRRLCFGQFLVLRMMPPPPDAQRLSCSVVIPCYNEEGNIAECLERIPAFGTSLEIIVVDDGSRDNTKSVVEEVMKRKENVRLISYARNRGKGYAINEGWKGARGDVLMMLDCDMTTPPEELPNFHYVMECGAEFINGSRIVYPREKHSLGRINRIGITLFALLIRWITQRRITDTFCGTKVLLKRHWEVYIIKEFLWGDWDLFFAAARYRMKMVEFPVHYRTRKAGEAKMRPFRHGFKLLIHSLKGLRMIR